MKETFLTSKENKEIANSIGVYIANFNSSKVIITGGLGFLGTHFLHFFKYINDNILSTPVTVYVLDNQIVPSLKIDSTNNFIFKNDNNIIFKKRDIRIPFDIEANYIINAAGIASPYYYQKYPLDTLDVSYLGTKNVLKNAEKYNARVLQFSSSEIYGNPDEENIPTSEDYKGLVSSIGPRSCYDEGKRIGEALSTTYHKLYNTNVSIVRPFNIYGPGMRKSDYRVIPAFANSIFTNTDIQIHGTGKQTRTYCYIADALIGLIKALLIGEAGTVYNIGNNKPEISVMELAILMLQIVKAEYMASDSKIMLINYPISYPADEPMRRCPDINKAEQHLQYQPKITLEEGLDKYFHWKVQYDN